MSAICAKAIKSKTMKLKYDIAIQEEAETEVNAFIDMLKENGIA